MADYLGNSCDWAGHSTADYDLLTGKLDLDATIDLLILGLPFRMAILGGKVCLDYYWQQTILENGAR